MSKKHAALSVSLLLALVLLSGCGGSRTTELESSNGPKTVVDSFYSWYLDSMAFDPEAGERYFPSEEEIDSRPELSNEMLSRRLEVLASFGEVGGYDPLICAQDVPTGFQSKIVEVTEEEALVRVDTSFESHGFSVRLKPFEEWQIVEVKCDRD